MKTSTAEETPPLSDFQKERYARQIMQPELGEPGQRKLAGSAVLVTRLGGLGGPAAASLALAGVGKLVLVHPGKLVEAGLNRMTLMSESGLGKLHATLAADALRRYRKDLQIDAHPCAVTELPNLEDLVKTCDVVISAAPTFDERRRLNEACVKTKTPVIEAAMTGFSASLFTVVPGKTACLHCVFPNDAGWAEPFPVIGAIPHALGAMAALEAIKLLTGQPALAGKMVLWDAKAMTLKQVSMRKNAYCTVCGDRR